MYKLLCTDMDGTLLNDDKVISERNLKAIKLAHEKGVKIAVCTGRLFTSADYFSELLGVKSPVIASNGAYIREKDRDEVIYKGILGKEKSRVILKVFRKYNIYPHFYTSDIIFTQKLIHSSLAYMQANKKLPKDKQIRVELVHDWESVFCKYEDEILKAVAVDEDEKKIKLAKEELRSTKEFEVVSSLHNNFEVMNKGISKGRAVEILASFYGINRDEVICIGDNENDLSMIEYAGLGVVMGNAEEEIKSIAKFVTDTNNNDGVAKVIAKFILLY